LERASSEISRIARELGMESSLGLERLRARWDSLFSGALPAHASPLSLRKGELLVAVDSPAWLQELNFMKARMLGRLTAFGVSDIRFRLGAVRRGRKGGRPEPPPPTDADRSLAEALVAPVRDEDLRESIRRAVLGSLRRGRRP